MTNVPPPDPDSSRLGFDELIGIVIAFATIGTILVVTLGQRDKGLNLNRFLDPEANKPTTKPVGVIPLLQPTPLPTATSEASPLPLQEIPRQEKLLPSPSVLPATPLSASPVPTSSPVPTATPKRVTSSIPIPVVVPIASQPKAEASATKTPATPATPVNFSDVPQNLWARPYIETLATQGIVTGFPDGTFKPGGSITRAEYATLLQKAFEQNPKSKVPNYKDVSANFWALPAIQETVATGFLLGYPGNIFRPNQPITRVQAIVALANGLGLNSTNATSEALKTYQDANGIPNYAQAPVSAATKAGLVVNYPNPNILNPNRNASRAEVAALVYQALVQSGKVEPLASEYLVKP
jgi:hypothetical protein